MATKDIAIGLASETRAFKQGIETGVIKPIEDAVVALDDLGTSRGPEQLERGLKDAQDASKRLERETKETADTIEREFRSSYRKVGQSADDGMRTAGNATRAFKDEAKQNFVEVGSSFDGSVRGVADGIQGTLAGASIAVGGAAGVALGAMAVVGGAVGNAMVNAIEEDAKASEDRIKSMYESFIESGLTYLTQEQALSALSALTGDPEQLKKLQDQAKTLGVDIATILDAQVRGGESRNEVMKTANALLDESLQKLEDGTYVDGDRLVVLEAIVDNYKKLNGEQDTAIQGAELYRAAAETITGEQILSNEQIQIRNRRLAETPREITTKIVVDPTALDRELARPRKVRLDAEIFTRQGTRVF